jgi:hypothetical protein
MTSALSVLLRRELALAAADEALERDALAQADTDAHHALQATFNRLQRRFKNVDLSASLRPRNYGLADWWAYVRPPHVNMEKSYLDFNDGVRIWRFERMLLGVSFLIGEIESELNGRKSKSYVLFDIRDPAAVYVRATDSGRCQFAQIARVEGNLFAIHDGERGGFYDDELQPVAIEGAASFAIIVTDSSGLCFVSLGGPQRPELVRRDYKATREDPLITTYAVNPVVRRFVRLPAELTGTKVQYSSEIKYRPDLAKLIVEYADVWRELCYHLRADAFVRLYGSYMVRHIGVPSVDLGDEAYLVMQQVGEEREYLLERKDPTNYIRCVGMEYRTFQHCNIDFRPLRALKDAEGWRLVRAVTGEDEPLVAPDGMVFRRFDDIRNLPSVSGNGANWIGAFKTLHGWICAANDEVLVIDGSYYFDEVQVDSDHQVRVFVVKRNGKEWPMHWYYAFEVCK